VSLTQRAVAAIAYEVTAVDAPLRLVIQSELVANEPIPPPSGDPRAAGALGGVLEPEGNWARDEKAGLVHRTKSSGLGVAAAMDHEVAVDANVSLSVDSGPNLCRLTASCALAAGATLRMVKYLAYGWSSERSLPALADQVAAALTAARATGWEDLLSEQRAYLDEFWARADVLVDGDAEVQQAVRFALFHLLQAGCRAEGQPIAAKGLTGSGYDGHCFWDTEAYVLPVLTYTAPHAARDALRWRHSTLSLARRRAEELGHSGAAFPWRTIHGEECSGYWPAGTAAVHIAADIADAVVRYLDATDDDSFAGDSAWSYSSRRLGGGGRSGIMTRPEPSA
jgi:alpha,alpha-trehalose phosphorylase